MTGREEPCHARRSAYFLFMTENSPFPRRITKVDERRAAHENTTKVAALAAAAEKKAREEKTARLKALRTARETAN